MTPGRVPIKAAPVQLVQALNQQSDIAERGNPQPPRQVVGCSFFHPDYTVGVGIAGEPAHRTRAPNGLPVNNRLATRGLPRYGVTGTAMVKVYRRSGIGWRFGQPSPCPEG
jgi:hypothetical protein